MPGWNAVVDIELQKSDHGQGGYEWWISGAASAHRTAVVPRRRGRRCGPRSRRRVDGISSRCMPVLVSVLLMPKTFASVGPPCRRVKRMNTLNRELLKLRRTALLFGSVCIDEDLPVVLRALSCQRTSTMCV